VDYLVIIDFEANCDCGDSPLITRENQEMIEFPFVVISMIPPYAIDPHEPLSHIRILHQEQHFVKPQYSTHLTSFCTELTGITDEIIEKRGRQLREVMRRFNDYVEKNLAGKKFCILTDGEWDIKQLLMRESKNKNIPLKKYFYSFFDLRKEFRKCFPFFSARSLASMVEHSGLQFVGRHHSGLDDCLTICSLVNYLLQSGHKFLNPDVIDQAYDPFRDASFGEFRRTSKPVYYPQALDSKASYNRYGFYSAGECFYQHQPNINEWQYYQPMQVEYQPQQRYYFGSYPMQNTRKRGKRSQQYKKGFKKIDDNITKDRSNAQQ